MSAVQVYAWWNCGWQALQGLPLVLFPKFIHSLLRQDNEASSLLENYYAQTAGCSYLAIGLIVVVLSGAVPLTSAADGPNDVPSPYASAVLLLSSVYNAVAAFYCYGWLYATGQTGYLFGCLGNALLGSFGLWCLLFAGDKAMISKYHHFDKGTSGFPFNNAQSYRSKKKGL